jgi:hypothetical protein
MLSGVLERAPQPRAESPAESESVATDAAPKGRGANPVAKPGRAPTARTARRIKGRTVYIPDDLFERIIVQAHRRDVTISDYVCLLLERHVPDHRRIGPGVASSTEQGGEADAA